MHDSESKDAVLSSESTNAVRSAFDMTAPLKITGKTLDRLTDRTDPETAREVWREASARALARDDPIILATYIVRTAYRLIREWARTIGVLSYDSALSSLPIDKLLIAQPHGDPPMGPFAIRAYAALRRIVEDKTIPDSHPTGLPLMPSKNKHFTKKHQAAFSDAMRHLSSFLQLDTCEYTVAALPFLIQTPPDPKHWPEPTVLYAYEGALIDEVLGRIIEEGTRNTETFLQKEHGFLPHEARGLSRLAKFESKHRMEAEIEEDRAILAMRLEDLIARARTGLDMRVELGSIKQLSIVLGVTRAEPADALSEFANVIRKVSNEAKQPLLDEPKSDLLTS